MFEKINGSAGHGKTHALIAEVTKHNPSDILLVTPTNKAAQVLNGRLRSAGYPPIAKTLHSTLYKWTETDILLSTSRTPVIDSATSQFQLDSNGKVIYNIVENYLWKKEVKQEHIDKKLFVDESSMVCASDWYHILNHSGWRSVHAYGDEKQLPPIEIPNYMEEEHLPYIDFWHNYNDDVTTLTINYRQQGALKQFMSGIESSLFSKHNRSGNLPTEYGFGENFIINSRQLEDNDIKKLILSADIIITPENKVRQLVNVIKRKEIARLAGDRFSDWPVVGDRMIFKTNVKDGNKLVVANNTLVTVLAVKDKNFADGIMVVDFITDDGEIIMCQPVSGSKFFGTKHINGVPNVDYAYAVTVHSCQGGQWDDVLYLDSWWRQKSARELRYTAVTRAKERVSVLTNIDTRIQSQPPTALQRISNNIRKV